MTHKHKAIVSPCEKLLSVHVRDAFRISTWSLSSGLCFKRATHGICCSSAGAGSNQAALYYCWRHLLDCIHHKASCTEQRGPYRDGSV